MLFVYDSTRVNGGCWICYRGYDSNTNTIGYQVRTNSTKYKASDKGYAYRIWLQTADEGKFMPVNTSSATNGTTNLSSSMNTRKFLLGGDIRYYSTNATTNANADLTATTMWQQYTFPLSYSFNNTSSALSLTVSKPVYMVCTDEGNGLGKLISPYYTQTLPTNEDGKLYVLLGYMYSATNLEMTLEHPIFEYRNGSIGLWSSNSHTHSTNDISGLEFQQISLPSNLGAELYVNDYICILEINHSPGAVSKTITTSWSDIDTITDDIPKVPDQYAPTTPVMSMSSGTMNILVKIGDTNNGKGVVQVRMISGTGTLPPNNYIRCTLAWRRPPASIV